jgi:hypothetical protein
MTIVIAYPCSAVVDVQRRGVVAAVAWTDAQGRYHRHIRTFTAASADIGQLGAWLARHDVASIVVVSLDNRQKLPPALLQERLFALVRQGPHDGALPFATSDLLGSTPPPDPVAADSAGSM